MTWPAGGWDTGRADGDADVVLFGDSITSGSNATDHAHRSYAQILRDTLRTVYGDGGSGFSPHWAGTKGGGVFSNGGTTSVVQSTIVPNGNAASLAGGARLTLTAEGTFVAVYLRRAPGDGTGRWRVDDGPWQALNCTGANGYVRATADGLPASDHLIEVESVTGTIAVAGTEGRNLEGCRLHIMGMGGRTSGGNTFGSLTQEATPAFREATIGRWAPHLLVVNLGVNDVSRTAGLVPVATYKANIEAAITTARAVRSDCDLVLVANHLGQFPDNNDYAAYIVALRQLVDTYGGLVVDLDTWARTVDPDDPLVARTASWDRWSLWGWWSGGETVHPNDVGHAAIGYMLGQVLTAAEGDPPVPSFETGGLYP